METVYPDTSEFQVPVNDSFNRRFFMFRISNEYGRRDYKADANLAWSISARASKKIDNFGVYVIPCVSSNDIILNTLSGVPTDCVIMIDMEGWGGLVKGNQSSQLNALATSLRNRQGGRADLVWGYGNRGDLAGIWPTRPDWLGFIVAGYGSSSMNAPGVNMIGWQFTNGVENGTAYPKATPPFGNCDHNVLYIPIPLASGSQQEDDEMKYRLIARKNTDAPTTPADTGVYAYNNAGMWWHVPSPPWLAVLQTDPDCLTKPGDVYTVNSALFDALKAMADAGVSGSTDRTANAIKSIPSAVAAVIPAAQVPTDAVAAASEKGATTALAKLNLVNKGVN